MNRCVHAIYSGWVQGVGFRFTAERLAMSLGLKGWVKNTRDGRVEIVCEGPEDAITEFLAKIAATFKTYIQKSDIEWVSATGRYEGFDIAFD